MIFNHINPTQSTSRWKTLYVPKYILVGVGFVNIFKEIFTLNVCIIHTGRSGLAALMNCGTSLLVVTKDLLPQDLLRSLDRHLRVVVLALVAPLFRMDDVLLALEEVSPLIEGDHVRRLRLWSHDDRRCVADEAVVSTDVAQGISLLRVVNIFQFF